MAMLSKRLLPFYLNKEELACSLLLKLLYSPLLFYTFPSLYRVCLKLVFVILSISNWKSNARMAINKLFLWLSTMNMWFVRMMKRSKLYVIPTSFLSGSSSTSLLMIIQNPKLLSSFWPVLLLIFIIWHFNILIPIIFSSWTFMAVWFRREEKRQWKNSVMLNVSPSPQLYFSRWCSVLYWSGSSWYWYSRCWLHHSIHSSSRSFVLYSSYRSNSSCWYLLLFLFYL